MVALIAGLTFALRGAPRHDTPSAEAAGLQGVVWLLQGTPGTRSTATLYIGRDGTLVADDECRLLGGHASVTGNRLAVSALVVRDKACTDQYGAGFYDRGTKVLQGPATYAIDSGGLTITARAGSLRFLPAPQAVPPPSLDVATLTDTTWRAPDGKTLRIDAASGNISGTICAGRATVAGSAVTFTGCRTPVGQGTYLAAISGARLTLTAQGIDPGFSGMSSQLTFVWQPAEASIDPASLTGRNWSLKAVAGEPDSTGTLRIANRSAVINDGCLSFTVPVRVARGVFSLSVHVPAHPCSTAAGTVDNLLSSNPTSWAVRGGKLIIYGGGSQTFSLVYAAEPESSTLQGNWTLAKVFDTAGAPQSATATASLNIAANGAVTGTDGCRTFTGTVSTSGTSATFSLTMPEPACSPSVEQTAGLVDRVLSGSVTFVVGNGLLVLDHNEIGRLSFTDHPTGGPNPALLTDHSWQIDTITYGTGHFRNGAAAQDGGARLSFTGIGYRIEHACYIVSGTAEVTSGFVTFQSPKIDDHSCPPPPTGSVRDVAAQAIDKILTGQVRWSVAGSALTLTGARGSVGAVGGLPANLTGSRWRLISTARANSSSTAVGSVMLSFPSARQLTVERCYTSGAQVEVGDSALVVFDLHTTIARPCPSGPPGTQQQNQIIDSVLAGEVMWSIAGDTLTLSADGSSLTWRR